MAANGFLWGVATAAYQVEGGINGPGEPLNDWAPWDASGRVERCGDALSFWTAPDELLGRAADLHCNAFRLSIEWARVQPSTEPVVVHEPEWDAKALDGYADIVRRARSLHMEPVVTLHHFTHPMWCGEHFWLDELSPQRFAAYAQRCVIELNRRVTEVGGDPLRWLITLNEPAVVPVMSYVTGMFPPGSRNPAHARQAHENIVAAHVLAYDAIHDAYEREGWPSPKVSTNTISWTIVAFDAVVADALLARERGVAHADLGEYLQHCARTARRRVAAIPRRDAIAWIADEIVDRIGRLAMLRPDGPALRALYDSPRERKLDYLSFDYYDAVIGNFFDPLNQKARGHRKIPFIVELWDQALVPEGLRVFLRQAHAQAPDKQILVAENGMATPGRDPRVDGLERNDFLRRMCSEVVRARDDEHLPIAGYLHWTLADNYEWGSYKPAFGLFGVDRREGPTILDTDAVGTDAAGVYREIIAADRGAIA